MGGGVLDDDGKIENQAQHYYPIQSNILLFAIGRLLSPHFAVRKRAMLEETEPNQDLPAMIDWEAMDLQPFDDGHVPENLSSPTKIVNYPLFCRQEPQVQVYQDALPEKLVDEVYKKTMEDNVHPSWGEYVTLSQIQAYWKDQEGQDATNKVDGEPQNLTIALVAEYLALTIGADPDRAPTMRLWQGGSESPPTLWTREDVLSQAHGVAVWALRSNVGCQVPYHLDYAEQVRYQHNVIVPPLCAGTLQCTRAKILGGAFQVAVPSSQPAASHNQLSPGILHYATHGYKGKMKAPTDLVSIPYRYNQLTCHLGDLPHASTPVTAIEGGDDNSQNTVRVIVGFNVFSNAVGPYVQAAPEHSHAFRQLVRRRKQDQSNLRLSLQRVKENKALSRLLVLAKRRKVQEDFRLAQEHLDRDIVKYLPGRIGDLIEALYTPTQTTQWPASPTDVHVYLDRQVHRGRLRIIPEEKRSALNFKPRDLIPLNTRVALDELYASTSVLSPQ